jgi:hypothetical protein
MYAGYLRLQIHTHTHIHTGCVIRIASPLQQWLHERTSMLRYTLPILLEQELRWTPSDVTNGTVRHSLRH